MNRVINRAFCATVGLREISITVGPDWDGRVEVSVRRYTSAGHLVDGARATCDVRQLLVGVVDQVRPEFGEVSSHEWPMFVALVVREHVRARAVAHLAQAVL